MGSQSLFVEWVKLIFQIWHSVYFSHTAHKKLGDIMNQTWCWAVINPKSRLRTSENPLLLQKAIRKLAPNCQSQLFLKLGEITEILRRMLQRKQSGENLFMKSGWLLVAAVLCGHYLSLSISSSVPNVFFLYAFVCVWESVCADVLVYGCM